MDRKYLKDVCEQLDYDFFECGDEILTLNEHIYIDEKGHKKNYDRVFILLDGTIEYQIDLLDPAFQDKDLVTIAENTGLNQNKIIKEVNDHRIEHCITCDHLM